MNRTFALALSCLALTIAAGCGGDDEEESGGGAAQTAEQPADTGGSAGGDTGSTTVSMKGIQFNPGEVTVAKGGTVTWTNDEDVGHDVTKEGGPGPDFKSGAPGAMKQGDTFKQKFTAAGKIDYVCTVHPNMTGTVTVK
jgi:plastocyanin